MKYKVGDKVRVRNDLVEYERYGNQTFVQPMAKYTGEQIIKEVRAEGYTIKADKNPCQYIWTDEMFEDIKEDKMDNNTLQINMNNLTDEERATLLSLVEKANKPVNKVWKPEDGEIYFYLFGTGSIHVDRWNNCDTDCSKYEIGNCFKTEKEAEFALERQKVITELKRYALEHNEKEIDWNDEVQDKFGLYFYHQSKKILINTYNFDQTTFIYFTSKEIARAAIETIGEERIKKYYFEVND